MQTLGGSQSEHMDPRARARQVALVAQEHAAHSETLGQLSPEVFASLQAADLPQLLKPDGPRDFREFIDVCSIVAEGCLSAGWCNFVWGMHNYVIGLYPEAVQKQVWQESKALVSASLGPVGVTNKINGDGACVSGHWQFNSGCDHAEWLLLGFTQPDGEPQLGLFHQTEYQLDDDSWDVFGLRGTGSKDVRVDAVQLPAERILPFSKCILPYGGLLVLVIVGPVLGGARSAVDLYAKHLANKVSSVTGKPLSQNSVALLRLAESSAEVDAARALVFAAADALDANPTPEPEITNRILRDTAFAAKLCNQATRRIFEASGGGALHQSHEMQRIFRNVSAACNHARLAWDGQALAYAQQLINR